MKLDKDFMLMDNIAIRYSDIQAVEVSRDCIYIYVTGVSFPFQLPFESGIDAQDTYDQIVELLKEKNNEKNRF